MNKLLLLLFLSASTFASAQITRITYSRPISPTDNGILNVDQVPYELFGEPDLLWGDVVRRDYVPVTGAYDQRDIIQNGRTFTVVVDQIGLQPEQHFVNYGRAGEWRLTPQGLQGATTEEMSKIDTRFETTFTVTEGTWQIWYSSISIDGVRSVSGGFEEFTVE